MSLKLNSSGGGSVTLQEPNTASNVTVNLPSVASTLATTDQASGFGFKNRIINGAMVIDQRNAGASVNPLADIYTLDRWRVYRSSDNRMTIQRNAGSVTPPAGFNNYLGVTSSSAYSVGANDYFLLEQPIEGFNFADLNFGTANARTFTLSFWVRSSLTGTFSGAFTNEAYNRTFAFTYTILAANTWEQKSITVVGDTTGTWTGATNFTGIRMRFVIGAGANRLTASTNQWIGGGADGASGSVSVVGTNGATFYITGVQLEAGATATSFDYRPYGTELALCQRYFERYLGYTTNWNTSASVFRTGSLWKVTKRTDPVLTFVGGYYQYGPGGQQNISSIGSVTTSVDGFLMDGNTPGGMTTNAGSVAAWNLTVNAEL